MEDKLADALLDSKQTGIEGTRKFFLEKLNNGKFWEKHSKTNTPTLSTTHQTENVSTEKQKKKLIQIDKNFIQRLFVISKSRNIDLEYVLSHEMTSKRLSQCELNGNMRHTAKSVFRKELNIGDGVTNLPSNIEPSSIMYAFDLMAAVRCL